MRAAPAFLADVPEEQQPEMVAAALEAFERVMRRHMSARMGGWSPARLAEVAAQRGARCVLTPDPSLPNGVRIDFEPLQVPAFLAEERPS